MLPVAIVGCGPAGLAAAIQLRRQGIETLVFEKGEIGGLLLQAWRVENYPGYPRGIAGRELARRFASHLQAWRVPVLQEELISADWRENAFWLATRRNRYRARRLIIASGTRPKLAGGISLSKAAKRRVSYGLPPGECPRGQAIAVVGAGDAAFDHALGLAGANDVWILGRSPAARALPLLQERAAAHPRIAWLPGVAIGSIQAAGVGIRILAARGREGERLVLRFDRAILAVGREPDLAFVGSELAHARPRLQRQGRLYLAGDVCMGLHRQASIAVGDGVRAAMEIAARGAE